MATTSFSVVSPGDTSVGSIWSCLAYLPQVFYRPQMCCQVDDVFSIGLSNAHVLLTNSVGLICAVDIGKL